MGTKTLKDFSLEPNVFKLGNREEEVKVELQARLSLKSVLDEEIKELYRELKMAPEWKSLLRADTESKRERILDILDNDLCSFCSFPLDLESYENDEERVYPEIFDDRVYVDGNVTFDKMAEIVDYLRATK